MVKNWQIFFSYSWYFISCSVYYISKYNLRYFYTILDLVVIYSLKRVPILLLLHDPICFHSFTAKNCFPLPFFLFSCHTSVSLVALVWFFHVKCAEIQINKQRCLTISQFSSIHHFSFSWLLELSSGSFLHFPSLSLSFLPFLFFFFFFLFLLLADPETLFSLTIQWPSVLLIHLPQEATTHPNNLRQHLFRCKY